jgi:hypothetical protein
MTAKLTVLAVLLAGSFTVNYLQFKRIHLLQAYVEKRSASGALDSCTVIV